MSKREEKLASGDLLVEGADYFVKMRGTGKVVRAKFNGKRTYPAIGISGRETASYHFTNRETGRDISVRSKRVILRPV